MTDISALTDELAEIYKQKQEVSSGASPPGPDQQREAF